MTDERRERIATALFAARVEWETKRLWQGTDPLNVSDLERIAARAVLAADILAKALDRPSAD